MHPVEARTTPFQPGFSSPRDSGRDPLGRARVVGIIDAITVAEFSVGIELAFTAAQAAERARVLACSR